ncbi:MAG: hypothetical protein HC904_08920 [Blastochloris sp.]|nr:hypothetical protein [Blastochloris sp.]
MDPAGFDETGQLFIRGASETPQALPGDRKHPELGNDLGLLPVSIHQVVRASSEAEGRDAYYAVDNYTRTWWQARAEDLEPWLEVRLMRPLLISACRILWREPGLDYDRGVRPGPMCYVVEARLGDEDSWQVVVDARDNEVDLLIDQRSFPEVRANRIRLRVIGHPPGIGVGVIDFTVFGQAE